MATRHVKRIELVRSIRELKQENKEFRMIVRELIIEEGSRIEINNEDLFKRTVDLIRRK